MLKLYKYMPFSTLLKFIDDPCLRVTPSYCQNDPFEFGYTGQDIDQLNSKSRNSRLGSELRDYSKLHGIVSLCSSKSDILMWTHYADKHKGAVVELHVHADNPQSLFINSTGLYSPPFYHSDFIFDKVNYEKKRHCPNIEQDINLEAVRKHYYFTKAKEWKPEQEYRFIIPLTWINQVLFSQDGYQKAKVILNKFPDSISCLNKDDSHNPNKTYKLNNLEYISAVDIQSLAKLWAESNETDTLFLIRLNSGVPGGSEGHIGRIYLGCRSNIEYFISYMKNNNHESLSIAENYHDIQGNSKGIYKGAIDDNEYKIAFREETFCIY